MMRAVSRALRALAVMAPALSMLPAPALAQVTYAPEITYAPVVGPATVVVPAMSYRVVVRPVLVVRTRSVRRTVLVPRARTMRRVLHVPVTMDVARTVVATTPTGPYGLAAPVAGYASTYPGTGLVGPTWVPPGTSYACQLGTVGCDSSVVGAMGF